MQMNFDGEMNFVDKVRACLAITGRRQLVPDSERAIQKHYISGAI